jgi:hypothetical protein
MIKGQLIPAEVIERRISPDDNKAEPLIGDAAENPPDVHGYDDQDWNGKRS